MSCTMYVQSKMINRTNERKKTECLSRRKNIIQMLFVISPVYCLPRAFISYPFYLKNLTPHYGKDIICGRVICALSLLFLSLSHTHAHTQYQRLQAEARSSAHYTFKNIIWSPPICMHVVKQRAKPHTDYLDFSSQMAARIDFGIKYAIW